MSVKAFRAFGVVTLVLNGLLFTTHIPQLFSGVGSTSQKLKVGLTFVLLTIIGFGLLNLRKWAALYFSLYLFGIGTLLVMSSITDILFPWNLLGMAHGVSLMLPAIVTVRLWSQLSWGGRWFF